MYREVNMPIMSLSVLIASVGLLSAAMSVLPTDTSKQQQQQQQQQQQLQQQQQQQQQQPQSINGSVVPYWRRHGCFKVGHTRTISIPGCLVFNLSTNACRGYCMSYSVPASSDTHHFSEPQRLEGAGKQFPDAISAGTAESMAAAFSRQLEDDMSQIRDNEPARETSETQQLAQRQLSPINKVAQSVALLAAGQPANGAPSGPVGAKYAPGSSATATAANTSPDERDLVTSYSQCCSMMETEEVIVNLRCGANENRRLVFKSAKTCECFFCKHV